MSSTNRAVIYARYSTDMQREESIAGQLRDCYKYAADHDLTVVAEYVDRAYSAKSDKRPDFQRMIKDAGKGGFDTIVVWKLDRFARNRYDSAHYKTVLKRYGVTVKSATEAIAEDASGIILEAVLEGMAEYYSADLAEKVRRGNRESALELRTVGAIPFGLRSGPDHRFEIDPENGPIVKEIFERYASGVAAVDIYTDLNRRGIRNARGNKFDKSSIRTIIKNEKYKGVYQYLDIYDPQGVPAIVSPELWQKANEMAHRHHKAPRAKECGGYLLTGKLFCGRCGGSMSAASGTSGTGRVYQYYKCAGTKNRGACDLEAVPKDVIEDAVVDILREIIFSDVICERLADSFIEWENDQRKESPIEGLEAQKAENAKQLDRLVNALAAGLDSSAVRERITALEAEKKEIERNIGEELLKLPPEYTRDQVLDFLRSFRNGNADNDQFRVKLVEIFLDRAWYYGGGDFALRLNFTGRANTYRATVPSLESLINDGSPLGEVLFLHNLELQIARIRTFTDGSAFALAKISQK